MLLERVRGNDYVVNISLSPWVVPEEGVYTTLDIRRAIFVA